MPRPTPIENPTDRHAGEEYLTREGGKLLVAEHNDECHEKGALAELRKWVTKLALWQATATGIGMLANGIFIIALAWWLSGRIPAQHQPSRTSADAPALINHAHAETKGPTP